MQLQSVVFWSGRSHQAGGRSELAALQPRSRGMAEDPYPALLGRQLLRTIDQSTQKRSDAVEHALDPTTTTVRIGYAQRRLAGVSHTFTNTRQ